MSSNGKNDEETYFDDPEVGQTFSEFEKQERTTARDPADSSDSLEERIKRKLNSHDEAAANGANTDPLIGTTINQRFQILSKIGEGGMGAVYRARQLGMNRDIAIKVLLRSLTENETVLRRFHLEALAVSKLKHPNTIQIFDFGETPDGLLFIAMELLEGKPLSKVLQEERQISVDRALHIIEQVAKSLREAHSKGIVHRDLKPDNIFLQAVGEDADFAKVLDFGVAKVADGDGQQKTLTKAGAIFGTPKYMSPEQSRGVEIDARSDVYALGVILYEMLIGRVPFVAENPLGVLIKHLQEPPPTFASLRPETVIPEVVERYVQRLLAKSVSDRPQTAEAVVRETEELRKQLPHLFRKVVTRKDVEAAGLEVETLSPTAMELVRDDTITRTPTLQSVPQPKPRKTPKVLLSSVVVLGAGVMGAFLAVPKLEPSYYEFTQVSGAPGGDVRAFEVESVAVSLTSVPTGALIFDQSGVEIGKTPFILKRNKNSSPERYSFEAGDFAPEERTIRFEGDGSVEVIFTNPMKVGLQPQVPSTPKPQTHFPKAEPLPTPPKVQEVAPVEEKPKPKPVEVKAAEPKPEKPTWQGPAKVIDTKSNPYGDSGGGAGGGAKANPYGGSNDTKSNPYD